MKKIFSFVVFALCALSAMAEEVVIDGIKYNLIEKAKQAKVIANNPNIFSDAFSKCQNLEEVYCSAKQVPFTSNSAFDNSYIEYSTLYVPTVSINAYKAVSPWKEFGTIKAIEGDEPPTVSSMIIKIEGKEIHNGDYIIVRKEPETFKAGLLTMYDLGVETECTSLLTQTITGKGEDLDKKTPGLAVCPTGFTCTTANADNCWLSTCLMNLSNGQKVTGQWIHYYYQKTKPEEGTSRTSQITFSSANEVLSFTLRIDILGEPSLEKCEKPSISYENGHLYFTTLTDGAEIKSTINSPDFGTNSGNDISLTGTYNITAYATKSGMEDSDVTTATLVWLTAKLEQNVPTSAKAIEVPSIPVLITSNGGMLTVTGIEEGTEVSAFSADGKKIDSVYSTSNTVTLNASSVLGNIAVVKVGDKSVKVMVK